MQQVFWQVLSGLANPYMLSKGCWLAPALEVPQGTSPGTNLFASILAGGMASPEQGPPGQQLQPNSSCLCAEPSAPQHPPQLWLEITPLQTFGPRH